jgi:hypothetical protein
MGGVPLAMLDVLGASMLSRVTDCMRQHGVGAVGVLSEMEHFPERTLGPDVSWFKAEREQLWRYAEALFNDFAQGGAELIVVMRLGPYINLDLERLLQFHLDRHSRVTQARGSSGKLFELLVVSASRRNDAAHMFRSMLTSFRSAPEIYEAAGYENALETAADLRLLAVDTLAGKTGLRPMGEEIKPGVWVGQNARIHSGARVLAPAYIGAHSRIRPMAVITRGSVIERYCHIDCGSVIEDSTILPFSHVGAGLDVGFSVIGFRRVAHLRRQVEVEIADERLIGMASTSAPVRALHEMLSLALAAPKALLSSLRAKQKEVPATLPEVIQAPSPALSAATIEHQDRADRQFATELMAARRYGNE